MKIATDSEFKKNIDVYLNMLKNGDEITVTDENGKKFGKFAPVTETPKKNLNRAEVDEVIKSLTGIIKGNYSLDEEKENYLRAKYDIAD